MDAMHRSTELELIPLASNSAAAKPLQCELNRASWQYSSEASVADLWGMRMNHTAGTRSIRTCIVFLGHEQNVRIHAVRAKILMIF